MKAWIFVCFLALFCLGVPGGQTSAAIVIINCTELQAMQDSLSGDYILANDIDCSETINWNGGLGFEPIGDGTNKFTGTFDGQGHTISDLYINSNAESDVGLFGYIDTGASISNVGLVNVDISGDDYVGGLVGYNFEGTITNSYATGNVNGDTYVEGLVSDNYGTIENSWYSYSRF